MGTQAYLIDELTDHEISVIHAANKTAADASSGLLAMYRRIQKLLQDTPTSQYYRLSNDIEALLLNEMRGVAFAVRADLDELALIEAQFAQNLLVTATTIDTIGRLPESILATFSKKPINNFVSGKEVSQPTVNELLAILGKTNARKIRNIVRDASLQGKTAKQISKGIKHLAIGVSRREIEATVLTAFNHYSTQANDAVYMQNADILDGIKLVATLDSRTTIVCMGFDGEVFPLGSGPRPPFHYRCRTLAVPQVKEKYRIPIKGRTRASETGPVDAQTKYSGFLRSRGKERQDQILGPTRAKAFRRGLTIDKFTNDQGVQLTIRELSRLYPSKFPN